jgi:hypothetical protein
MGYRICQHAESDKGGRSSNIKFHRQMEVLSEDVWCPDGQSRWFYERTRGAYKAAYMRYGTTPKKKREFRDECPKSQKFGKTDLACYLVAWGGEPQEVCSVRKRTSTIS